MVGNSEILMTLKIEKWRKYENHFYRAQKRRCGAGLFDFSDRQAGELGANDPGVPPPDNLSTVRPSINLTNTWSGGFVNQLGFYRAPNISYNLPQRNN